MAIVGICGRSSTSSGGATDTDNCRRVIVDSAVFVFSSNHVLRVDDEHTTTTESSVDGRVRRNSGARFGGIRSTR